MNTRTDRPSYDDARRHLNRGIGNAKSAAANAAEAGAEFADRTRETASDFAEAGSEYARSASLQARSFARDLENSIHRNPLMAVGIAAFVGWMYGYFRRRG